MGLEEKDESVHRKLVADRALTLDIGLSVSHTRMGVPQWQVAFVQYLLLLENRPLISYLEPTEEKLLKSILMVVNSQHSLWGRKKRKNRKIVSQ